jgi:hypothetical protein
MLLIIMEKRDIKEEFNSDLKKGLVGLRISLVVLVVLVIAEFFFLVLNQGFSEAFDILLRIPSNQLDFLALFGGVLIFIAIPFTTSIYIKKFK